MNTHQLPSSVNIKAQTKFLRTEPDNNFDYLDHVSATFLENDMICTKLYS